MITRGEAEELKERILQLLEEDTTNTERLLGRLDVLTSETGISAHAALLLILTQLAFDEDEARGHWEGILEHRHTLSLALGRDAGLRVATLDYFVNRNKRLTAPSLIDLEMEGAAVPHGADPLTGLASDRAFRVTLAGEMRRARRYGHRVAIALFDLDGFAALNARVGRLVADRLLREAGLLLSNKIRDIDLAARPGEDELAILLPETTRNGAFLVAERFRRDLEAHFKRRDAGGRPADMTVSAGVAAYPDDATEVDTLITRAAGALYLAKASGKNAVLVHSAERRRFLRFDLAERECEVEVLSSGEPGARTVHNLSRSGLLFGSPEPLHVGEEVEIRLDPAGARDGSPVMALRGRVVRLEELPGGDRDRFEIGVAFDVGHGRSEEDFLEFLERAGSAGPTERS